MCVDHEMQCFVSHFTNTYGTSCINFMYLARPSACTISSSFAYISIIRAWSSSSIANEFFSFLTFMQLHSSCENIWSISVQESKSLVGKLVEHSLITSMPVILYGLKFATWVNYVLKKVVLVGFNCQNSPKNENNCLSFISFFNRQQIILKDAQFFNFQSSFIAKFG